MQYDELAFVNVQLAGMLRSGIPLEGALRQLSTTLQRGDLQSEFKCLEADLAKGVPLREAIGARHLPDLYRRMILVGAQGNDLPGVLVLLADHYQRTNAIATRLKGLMVYPALVLVAALALSSFLAVFFRSFCRDIPQIVNESSASLGFGPWMTVMIWTPVGVLGVLAFSALLGFAVPQVRRWLRWHLPGFKEAALAQMASAMRLMLKGGTNLADALGLLAGLESQTPAGEDVALWQRRLAEGGAHFQDLAAGSKVVPPLFSWLVSSGGEDLVAGFERAAEIYQARAKFRVELLLYTALPVSILFLGVMLVSQAYPVIRLFVQFGSMIDQLGQ